MDSIKKPVYKSPQSGQDTKKTITSGCVSPKTQVKFCNLAKPFYYPNSPTIPRYSVTCIFDPFEDKEFLKGIQTIEKNERVATIVKNETRKEDNHLIMTGKVILKFQSKEKIPVYLVGGKEPVELTLEDELASGEKIHVVFEILRYTKKGTEKKDEYGLSFKPTAIYFYPTHPLRQEEVI